MMVQRKTGEPVTKVKKGFYGAKGRVSLRQNAVSGFRAFPGELMGKFSEGLEPPTPGATVQYSYSPIK